MFREHNPLPQLQRLKAYDIMLLTISLFTTSRQSPLSVNIIYKVHSCEKSNIIPLIWLSIIEGKHSKLLRVQYRAKAIHIP